jgi:hypothetical protein
MPVTRVSLALVEVMSKDRAGSKNFPYSAQSVEC